VIFKGPPNTTTSHSPGDVVANESNVGIQSFSTAQAAQNTGFETNLCELTVHENGKVSEAKIEAKYNTAILLSKPANPGSLHNSLVSTSESIMKPDICGEEEEDRGGPAKRAIITTHISAQNMRDPDRDGEYKNNYGEQVDNDRERKLGGIWVLVERVVEIEIDTAPRELTSASVYNS
jgi:hypothetical protein